MKTLARTLCCLMLTFFVAGLDSGALGQPQRGGAEGRRQRQMRPVIRGTEYAVSSMSQFATRAAVQILEAGGNAFDAIVAGHAVLALVDADSNGIGSDAVILLYDAESRRVVSVDAEGTAPQLATIDWYNENNNGEIPRSNGLLSATVPGMVDAWYTLLDRWGTMTFEEVLQPAIEVAGEGFPISESFARALGSRKLAQYPSSVKLYSPDTPRKAGDIFRNPDAARTLERLVEAEQAAAGQGRRAALRAARDLFYKGDIAREMATFAEENGGLFRYEDFAEYSVRVEEPVSVDYRGYQVYKNPSSNQGPAELFALNILEGYDLAAMGHNSAEYIHTSVEATKLAFADREFLGDTDFVDIPYDALLSKEYAAQRRALIEPDSASHEFRPGDPWTFLSQEPGWLPRRHENGEGEFEGDTSYIAVADADRNMVTITPSNHSGWGTGVVMGDLGFVFNCRGDYFSLVPGEPKSLAPGKRPRSTLQGTLVMKDGEPFLVTGSPGGDDQIMRTIQTLLNIVDFGMNVQQAIEAPRWATRSFPSSVFPHNMSLGVMSVEDRIPEEVIDELRAKGHELSISAGWSKGANGAILYDAATGVYSAGADPRVEAYAWAR